MYSKVGETVLDPMVGGGTTAVEAKLLSRNIIGVDINPKAIQRTQECLKFNKIPQMEENIQVGDARNLTFINDASIDLTVTHPPYMNIIRYSEGKVQGDISSISCMSKFCDEIKLIAMELFRVLKPGKYCAILIGDTRRGQHYVPLAFNVMLRFLEAGFVLKEDVVKIQHNCKTTNYWESRARDGKFYLIMHEHLFVFRKPVENENLSNILFSTSQVY